MSQAASWPSLPASVDLHTPTHQRKPAEQHRQGVTGSAGRAVQAPAGLAVHGDTAGRQTTARHFCSPRMHKHNLAQPHLGISPPKSRHDACALVQLRICRHKAWCSRLPRQWRPASPVSAGIIRERHHRHASRFSCCMQQAEAWHGMAWSQQTSTCFYFSFRGCNPAARSQKHHHAGAHLDCWLSLLCFSMSPLMVQVQYYSPVRHSICWCSLA